MTVVCTIGCFDLLHVGHLDFLHIAARLGDMLIVGIPSDELYAVLKGRPPVISAEDRAEMLMATALIDYVDILKSMDYAEWVNRVGPNVLVLSEDHVAERFVLACQMVEANCGRVIRLQRSERESTTAIIDRAVAIREGKI